MNANFNYDFLLYVKNLLLYYIIFLEIFIFHLIFFNLSQMILKIIETLEDFYNIIIA